METLINNYSAKERAIYHICVKYHRRYLFFFGKVFSPVFKTLYLAKERAFYRLNEQFVSNITGDIFFFGKVFGLVFKTF